MSTWEQKQCRREYQKKYRKKLKDEVYAAYGGYYCFCCGETEKLFLGIHHVSGDGAFHRKKNKIQSSTSFYRWLKNNNYPSDFQILCYNCNIGKYRNDGICPHHRPTSGDYKVYSGRADSAARIEKAGQRVVW